MTGSFSPRKYHQDMLRTVEQTLLARNIDFHLVMDPEEFDLGPACDHLVIFTRDMLTDGLTKSPVHEHMFAELTRRRQRTLVLTAVDGADQDFDISSDRIKFLHYGGDLLRQMTHYHNLEPQRHKDFGHPLHWISLNHVPRPHRVITACCLLGHGFGDQSLASNHGMLRISHHTVATHASMIDFLQFYKIDPSSLTHAQSELLELGFVKMRNVMHGGQVAGDIYGAEVYNNAVNFDRSLRSLYQNTALEVVNETSFFSKGIFVTEKFLNSVYGFNMPVIIGNVGTVDYLRRNGFDMLDDVIDHAYDLEPDPVQRIYLAISLNKRLFEDHDHAISCHRHCWPRLQHNYEFAKDQMCQHFHDGVIRDLKQYLS